MSAFDIVAAVGSDFIPCVKRDHASGSPRKPFHSPGKSYTWLRVKSCQDAVTVYYLFAFCTRA